MKEKKFSLSKRIQSFRFAFNGLKILWKEEHNARVHAVLAVGVLVAGFIFQIEESEWMAVIFAIGLVITAEIINSSIESMADFVSQEKSEAIRKVKDLAAAAVLISALTALCIGLVIFLPKIRAL